MNYDVVGLGQCCIDYLGTVENYPDINNKEEVHNFTIQGGGHGRPALFVLDLQMA